MFTDFSIIDEGKVPFLMSLPQMKNLGVSLDLRGTPEKSLFHTGFLKGQGVPLHRNRAGHLTLDVNEICRKAKVSADKGRQLHAASSFPAVADVPLEIPSHDPPQPKAAEPAIPPPASEKRYRLRAGQKVPQAQLHQRADQRAAERNKPEVKEPEEQGAPLVPPVPCRRRSCSTSSSRRRRRRSSATRRIESGWFDTSTSGEATSETLQEDRAAQASLEALSHELSTVPMKN